MSEPHTFPHLTPNEYCFSKGCKCDGCIEAHRAGMRRRTNRWRAKPGSAEKSRRTRLARTATRDEFIGNYKMSRGCADCGYRKHPRALDFDHVAGTKSFTIGGVNRDSKPMHQLLAEMEKCEVVCSNCHRIRSYNREQQKKEPRLTAVA
jgi:hypothetical protein